MNRDTRLLFATRVVRLFGYGLVSVILVLYLSSAGLDEKSIGLLLTFTLLGDTAMSLAITTSADRLGRRRMLALGAVLVAGAGAVFASARSFPVLLIAAIVGVISPSGNEVGPFLAIEQAALSQVVADERRTRMFAWYALAASFATAAGALAGGALAGALMRGGWPEVASYRVVVVAYAAIGFVMLALIARLSPAVEASRADGARQGLKPGTNGAGAQPTEPDARGAPNADSVGGAVGMHVPGVPGRLYSGAKPRRAWLGLDQSRAIVAKLSLLFGLDAFGGGFIVQSILAYWFHVRFGMDPTELGALFFGANVLAGLSALVAVPLATRFGLVRTMVFTHLPSNVMLFFVPLMPSAASAVALLLVRFSISQMDVPTRQSYTMAVVPPAERAAAAGVTGVTRTIGAALSPFLATSCIANPALINVPFFVAGALKIVYDLLLYRSFASLRPPEENRAAG